ncbi:MAG: DUF4982 domain-containing protein [bacterium]|nr:DUF4982 domain-containing protein [bacterium]
MCRNGVRQKLLLDRGWRFHDGDLPVNYWGKCWKTASYRNEPGIGRGYDDSGWRVVNLPHDFGIEQPFDVESGEPSRGYLPGGVGWYRRRIIVPSEWAGKHVLLEVEGAFRDTTVYVNESYVGEYHDGYTPFRIDVSAFLEYGEENVLAVRVDSRRHQGCWYEGGGLYRHVWVIVTDRLHIAPDGLFVYATVDPARREKAEVTVRVECENLRHENAAGRLEIELYDPSGNVCGSAEASFAVESWRQTEVRAVIEVSEPQLWSLETPVLYRARAALRVDGGVVDEYEVAFGIRSAVFDGQRGFLLNGEPLKIRGVCGHQDHGGLGWGVPDAIHRWRIRRLKEFGFNAIRTSHNMFSPALLDVCDREGVLVLAETRNCSTDAAAMATLATMVRAYRSRPSVIMWSLGNEEEYLQGSAMAVPVLGTMKALVRSLDPTRPVTMGMNTHHDVPGGPATVHDVIGFNYSWDHWDRIRALFPERAFIETEQANTYTTRGVYEDRSGEGYLLGYDKGNFWIRMTFTEPEVQRQEARPWMCGGFIWTGFDYRGEPLPYMEVAWKQCQRTDPIPPVMSCHFGVFDLAGNPKDIAWYYRAWYRGEPLIHVFPHWNWVGKEGRAIEVWAYTNAEEAELFVNGRSVGRQRVARLSHVVWYVPYEPGWIEAVGYRGGEEVCRMRRETTGPAVALRLRTERSALAADGEDCAVVVVDAVDDAGRHVPVEERLVRFETNGPIRILGVNNGDPVSREADKAAERRLFAGLATVIIQAGEEAGEGALVARAEGLREAVCTFSLVPAAPRAALPAPVTAGYGSALLYIHERRPAPVGGPKDNGNAFDFYLLNANTNARLG